MANDDQNKDVNNGDDNKDMVSKVDLNAAIARSEKLEKDLEDVRMEVLTPEYQKFLDAGDAGEDDKKTPDDEKKVPDDAFEKMSKKEIFDMAVQAAKDSMQGTLAKREDDAKTATAARNTREVEAFAAEHTDFQIFRPIMYGLSLDPKNADMSLDKLYQAAKTHVASIHREPTEEEKKKSRNSSNEKPGGDSSSLEKLSKMSNKEIAEEAWDEVEEKLGGLSV